MKFLKSLILCLGCCAACASNAAEQPPLALAATVFLAFDGFDIKPCDKDDQSTHCSSQLAIQNVAAFSISPFDETRIEQFEALSREAIIEDIRARVRNYYKDFSVEVVTTEPEEQDVTVIVVGGTYDQFGFPAPIGGFAPIDCNNANKNNIGFVFGNSFRPKIGIEPYPGVNANDAPTEAADVIAKTIAHELGHTFGLQHLETLEDVMYPSSNRYRNSIQWSTGTLWHDDHVVCSDYDYMQVVDHAQRLEARLGSAQRASLDP